MADISIINLLTSDVYLVTMGLGTVGSLVEDLGDSYSELEDALNGAHGSVDSDEEEIAYVVIKITK